MAERKAVNKYYPPAWTPDQGSINKFRGSHPLRDRARKLDQGIVIVRFELPYNIWCNGCGSHVGMGVRYNAEKSKVGNYYSTPIFKFRMKCHLCDSHFEIQTDPKNMDYVVVSGASRKNEKWEHKEGETVAVEGPSEAQRLASDPMYRLEHSAQDQEKAKEGAPRIARIIALQEERKDDYTLNQGLRKTFREEKARLKAEADQDRKVQERTGVSVPLVKEREEDVKVARGVVFAAGSSREDRKRKRVEIRTQSVFKETNKRQARAALVKACSQMDRSVFGRGTIAKSSSHVKDIQHSLGIRTKSCDK